MGARRLGAGVADQALIRRVLGAWAEAAAAVAHELARHEPVWGSSTAGVAGGTLVVSGAGLYVNRVLAAGIDTPLTDADIGFVIERSSAAGLGVAGFEVSDLTDPRSRDALDRHGFEHDTTRDVSMMMRSTDLPLPESPFDIVIRSIGPASLGDWQEVAALGWGHTEPAARRASDAYARAVSGIEGESLMIAHDARDGRPLGCAALTRRSEVATLGGMSTVPEERRRGVQAALVRHRIEVALDAGCTVIVSSAASGGASRRNLERLGFRAVLTVATLVRSL